MNQSEIQSIEELAKLFDQASLKKPSPIQNRASKVIIRPNMKFTAVRQSLRIDLRALKINFNLCEDTLTVSSPTGLKTPQSKGVSELPPTDLIHPFQKLSSQEEQEESAATNASRVPKRTLQFLD